MPVGGCASGRVWCASGEGVVCWWESGVVVCQWGGCGVLVGRVVWWCASGEGVVCSWESGVVVCQWVCVDVCESEGDLSLKYMEALMQEYKLVHVYIE